MIKIRNETGHEKINEAITYFHSEIPKYLKKLSLSEARSFTYTELTDRSVAIMLDTFINRSNAEIAIRTYRPWYRWSSAIGYTEGSNVLYLNEYKISKFLVADYAGNIGHEICHLAGFGHGSNKITASKKLSVPYAIGYLISGESQYPLNKYRQVYAQ